MLQSIDNKNIAMNLHAGLESDTMDPADKTHLSIALVFGSQQKILTDALDVSPGTTNAWIQGGSISSDIETRQRAVDLKLYNLLDEESQHTWQLYTSEAAGRGLARKNTGMAYLCVEETMKPWVGEGAYREAGEPGEVARSLSLERTEKPRKPGNRGPKKNHGSKEEAK